MFEEICYVCYIDEGVLSQMQTSDILDRVNLNYDEQLGLTGAVNDLTRKYPIITQIILYGSKAKGGFLEDSDIDILIVTQHIIPREVKHEVSDIIYNHELAHDIVISALIVSESDYRNKLSPFLMKVKKEGIVIWSKE